MSKVLIIGGHGLGDCMMALQCAIVLQQHSINPKVIISARDEVYKPLQHMFGMYFDLQQVDETYASDNNLLKDESLMKQLADGYDEVYYVIPDLMFFNKYAFDFKKYHTSPQMIRDIRVIGWSPETRNSIYLGLMTTTPGYMFSEPVALAYSLAYALPNYEIYCPVVTKWAGKDIKSFDIPPQGPGNLRIVLDPEFNDAINELHKACYFVGTDNGPSHLAYHLGIPRLLLDPQFNRLPWIARWREDYLESIPITVSVEDVTSVVKTNLLVPQTTLIPRMVCLANGERDWEQLLWLKSR